MKGQKVEPFYNGVSVVTRGTDLGRRYEFDRDGVNVILWRDLSGEPHVTVESMYGDYGEVLGKDDHYENDCTCADRLMESYVPNKYIDSGLYASLCCKIMAGDLFGNVKKIDWFV